VRWGEFRGIAIKSFGGVVTTAKMTQSVNRQFRVRVLVQVYVS